MNPRARAARARGARGPQICGPRAVCENAFSKVARGPQIRGRKRLFDFTLLVSRVPVPSNNPPPSDQNAGVWALETEGGGGLLRAGRTGALKPPVLVRQNGLVQAGGFFSAENGGTALASKPKET